MNTKKTLTIALVCFLSYFACYLARHIFSASMPLLIENGILSEEKLGFIASAFLFVYGIGQCVNGAIGDKVSGKYMVFCGLFASGCCCILSTLFSQFILSLILWCCCGFFCSMIWGPISKIVGENTLPKSGKIILTSLTIASVLGTLFTYLFALCSSVLKHYAIGFYITGGACIVFAILWFFIIHSLEKKQLLVQVERKKEKSKNGKFLLNIEFIAMLFVTMLNGIIRNAIVFWTPTFISLNFQMSSAISSLITILLPIFNVIATFSSLFFLRLFKNNEKKCCLFCFCLTTFMFLLVFCFHKKNPMITIICLFIAIALMIIVSNLIFSVYVLKFAKTGKLSTITGFLDFSSYMSASFASLLFTKWIAKSLLNYVTLSWLIISCLGIPFCFIAWKNNKEI